NAYRQSAENLITNKVATSDMQSFGISASDKFANTYFPQFSNKYREFLRAVRANDRERMNELYSEVNAQHSVVPGEAAFVLADTYGFPIDLTELMAREQGRTVDRPRFNELLNEQKGKGRQDYEERKQIIELAEAGTAKATQFVGYDDLEVRARV